MLCGLQNEGSGHPKSKGTTAKSVDITIRHGARAVQLGPSAPGPAHDTLNRQIPSSLDCARMGQLMKQFGGHPKGVSRTAVPLANLPRPAYPGR